MILKIIGFLLLIIWLVYAFFITKFTRKTLEIDLKYLFEPDVNLYASHDAAARYDQFNLRKWEIYLGAIFLIPIRAIISLPFFVYGEIMKIIIWKVFNGKILRSDPSNREKHERSSFQNLQIYLLLV